MSQEDLRNTIKPTVDALMDLGFQKYESEVLAILTAIGTATVKEIHQHTTVPLPKVYQTIESLSKKGLLKQHSKTRPVKYTAYSPAKILRLINQKNREMEERLKTGLDELSELTVPDFIGDISPFTGVKSFKRIATGLLSNTEKEVSIAMSGKTLALFRETLNELKERGVKLRSMTFDKLAKLSPSMKTKLFTNLGFDHYTVPFPEVKPNLKLFGIIKKLADTIDYLGIIISDSDESVVLLPLFPNETYFGIWINAEQIVKRQLKAYDELFKIASKAN